MPDMSRGDAAHFTAVMLDHAQKRFGALRLELGAILATIQDYDLWRGQATSFTAFLEERHLNVHACKQYMRVARAFFSGLKLDADALDELADVPMGVLDLAAKVVSPDNVDDMIAQLTKLRERDAKAALEGMATATPSPAEPTAVSPAVARMRKQFWDLPDDQRIEFMHLMQSPLAPPPAQASPPRDSG